MASLRISLINEARRLAVAAGDPAPGEEGFHVPPATVERLHDRLRGAEEPARILRWAWRTQRARFDTTGRHCDGLAALYLLAALIELQRIGTTEPMWSQRDLTAHAMGPLLPTMAGAAHRA